MPFYFSHCVTMLTMGVNDEYAFAQVNDGTDYYMISNPCVSVCENSLAFNYSDSPIGNDAFCTFVVITSC